MGRFLANNVDRPHHVQALVGAAEEAVLARHRGGELADLGRSPGQGDVQDDIAAGVAEGERVENVLASHLKPVGLAYLEFQYGWGELKGPGVYLNDLGLTGGDLGRRGCWGGRGGG